MLPLGVGASKRDKAWPLGWNPPQGKTKQVRMRPSVTPWPGAWKSLCRRASCPAEPSLCTGPGLPGSRSQPCAMRRLGAAGHGVAVSRARKLVSLHAGGGQTIFHQGCDPCACWERSKLHIWPVQKCSWPDSSRVHAGASHTETELCRGWSLDCHKNSWSESQFTWIRVEEEKKELKGGKQGNHDFVFLTFGLFCLFLTNPVNKYAYLMSSEVGYLG